MGSGLISRRALIKTLDHARLHGIGVRDAVKSVPDEDAEIVRHGRWDAQGWEDEEAGKWRRCGYKCSNCGRATAIKTPGCPWCRAKMDEATE